MKKWKNQITSGGIFLTHTLHVVTYMCIYCVQWTDINATRTFAGDYPQLEYILVLRRRPRYYVINIILPCCLLSFITVATFLLQPNCYDRLGLSMYKLLAYLLIRNCTFVGQHLSPMTWYALVLGSRSCPTLSAAAVCPSLDTCTAPTPHKTITVLYKPA